MKKEDIAKEVEKKFQLITRPIKVIFREGKHIEGSFELFKDYTLLREKHQYRFVPTDKVQEFNESFNKTGEADPLYSIMVDCADVIRVEFV